MQADLALASDQVEIHLERQDFLASGRFDHHRAGRIDHRGAADAARVHAVDVEHVALELRRRGARDGELDAAVDGAGQHRMQQHLDAGGDQAPRGLRKPDIVADGKPEAADLGHVEDAEFRALRHVMLVRVEGKHLAVAPDHLARRVDDAGRIIDPAILGTLETSSPESARCRSATPPRKTLPSASFGRGSAVLVSGPKGASSLNRHHLHPGKACHHQIDSMQDRLDIAVHRTDRHLNAGNGEGRHAVISQVARSVSHSKGPGGRLSPVSLPQPNRRNLSTSLTQHP